MMHMPTDPEPTPMKEFVYCLTQQLSELDLLKSMYPNHGELTLSNKDTVNQINKFIDGASEYVPNNLEFVITLVIDNLKLEICVNLPVTYPNKEPDIYIRCNQLNRQRESNLNTELTQYIKSIHNGEVCLYTAITWLQDNIDGITQNKNSDPNKFMEAVTSISPQENRCTRLWIYSHHIFSKKKREEITKKAKELKLTGFCLPGKPGVICIEGDENTCKDWWQDVKAMSWKKIMIRKTETFESVEYCEWRKFSNFEELFFESTVNSKNYSMSEFSKFMKRIGFSDIFNDIFGFNE